MTASIRFENSQPILRVENMDVSIRFYTEQLGFIASSWSTGSFGCVTRDGVILFNARDPQNPAFDIRVRATKCEPDMFYVNRCMRLIEDPLFG